MWRVARRRSAVLRLSDILFQYRICVPTKIRIYPAFGIFYPAETLLAFEMRSPIEHGHFAPQTRQLPPTLGGFCRIGVPFAPYLREDDTVIFRGAFR